MKQIDVFLKFPSFVYNPANVGNLISMSSSFLKPCLDIWKFLVRIMLKPSMQDLGMRIDLFQSCGPCWVFQIYWYIECNTLMASSFRILNTSTGILSHPLALLIAVFLRSTWLHSAECLALGGWPQWIVPIQFILIFLIQFFRVFFPSLLDLFSIY